MPIILRHIDAEALAVVVVEGTQPFAASVKLDVLSHKIIDRNGVLDPLAGGIA
jgi:hypothetical protein